MRSVRTQHHQEELPWRKMAVAFLDLEPEAAMGRGTTIIGLVSPPGLQRILEDVQVAHRTRETYFTKCFREISHAPHVEASTGLTRVTNIAS